MFESVSLTTCSPIWIASSSDDAQYLPSRNSRTKTGTFAPLSATLAHKTKALAAATLTDARVLLAGGANATDKTLTLLTDDEMKMNAVWEVVMAKLTKRGVPVKNFKTTPSEAAAGAKVRRAITIQQGLPIETSKEIVKFIKDLKMKKVQASIQADQVRVTSPSKDELQQTMSHLRGHDFGISLPSTPAR